MAVLESFRVSLPPEIIDFCNLINGSCQEKKLLLKTGHYLRNVTSKGEKDSRHSYTIQDMFYFQ